MAANAEKLARTGDIASPANLAVWDIFVRIFHWSLVTSFAVAWLTTEEWNRLHEWAGYAAVALVAMRVLWGIIGTEHARFSDFITSPLGVFRYIGDILKGRERRYLGHNPVGGTMIIALLSGICGLGLTGWMMTSNAFWGVEWVEEVHEVIANGMLALIVLHVVGVLVAGFRHHENLVAAMVTGRKRAE